MITVSWQMPEKMPVLPVFEPEVRDAIRAKKKLFEEMELQKLERIVDIEV